MAKSILDCIIDNIFDAEWVGKRGEKLTERELNLVQLFGRKGKILRNVYVPKEGGGTSEIDVLFITQKGIFVIESKNYSGWIFGKEKDRYWTVTLPNKMRNKLYNPIMQNRTHIKWLGQYLKEEIPMFSLIVFSERCELKNITLVSDDIPVIKRDRIYATVRKIWNHSEDCLSEEQIEVIYNKLKVLTNMDKATKQAHIDSIQERFPSKKKDKRVIKADKIEEEPTKIISEDADTQLGDEVETEIKPEKEDLDIVEITIDNKEERETIPEVDKVICPRCGAAMILRVAKKGKNAGNSFYGCSAFPKCRYIQPQENEDGK